MYQVYAAILSCLNAFASVPAARIFSAHLTFLTLVIFSAYAYRDIWPLMTTTLAPIDRAEGRILWVKIVLLAVVALVDPLFEPFPYVPVDKDVVVASSVCFLLRTDPLLTRTHLPCRMRNKQHPSPRSFSTHSLIP